MRRGSLAVLIILVAAVLVAWFERRPIAAGYVDDYLRSRQVQARYTIADLGPSGQRLTDVVIGDPAHPDLTADWIETGTSFGFGTARVTTLRAGRVRVRGRIAGGRVSLGALDRLLPQRSGGAFALPDLTIDVADARLRLDTPIGPVGVKLTGRGGLQATRGGGFAGTLAAYAPRLARGGCVGERISAYWQVAVRRGAPRLAGPVRAARLACGDWRVSGAVATLDGLLDAGFDRIDGSSWLELADARGPGVWLTRVSGNATARGRFAALGGSLALASGPAALRGASATAVRVAGSYRTGMRPGFAGELAADHASLPARWRTQVARYAGADAGSPVAPLLAQVATATSRAMRDVAVGATLAVERRDGWAVRVTRTRLVADSGAALSFAGDEGLGWTARGTTVDGRLSVSGGGLPTGVVALHQAAPGAPLAGTARFVPYRAGAASLTLAPVTFRATPGGRTQFDTTATLSGPLGDGRIERATVPILVGWDGGGRVVVNPLCTPVGFARLAVAGLVLDRGRLQVCPVERALVTRDGARWGGGARLAAARLAGTLGGSPLRLSAAGGAVRVDGGFAVDRLAVRLGAGERISRLDLAQLSGRLLSGGVAGRYRGGAGRLGAVPLLVSEASGDWRLAGGRLTLDGSLLVADAATEPRFSQLAARDFALTLANGRITAGGTLSGPKSGVDVATVAIRHRLADSIGVADLTVAGLRFGPALQPNMLTRLTLGVIADVRGTVRGSGRIAWSPAGVTSTGAFGTDGIDLAAAFGPVTGLTGQIVFTDLLALQSAPGQVASVASINPGVPVTNGTIRYQTLPGPMIRIEGAGWPFAGGTLLLDPTLLDYSRDVAKRMTFRIDGLDAAQFLQGFDYKNLTATGTFDGTLPMVFDATGGRIEDGRLRARTGGTLAYVGEVSQENLGTWGNLAFGALKSLRYRALDLRLYGPLAGEIVTEARFGGIAQGEGAKSNFLIRRLARLPFVFNVKITAPFRSLLDGARGFYDPAVAAQRNLPTLIDQEKRNGRPVQPPASGLVPQEKQD